MNKALHALVYLILAAAATALYFEYNLYGKKELLKERNRQLEDYLVKISQTIEKADAPKAANAVDAGRDVSPIEAKDVDEPEKENLLEDYKPQLEEAKKAAEEARKMTAASVASGAGRVAENGLGGAAPTVQKADPSKFSREKMERIRKAAMAGETVGPGHPLWEN